MSNVFIFHTVQAERLYGAVIRDNPVEFARRLAKTASDLDSMRSILPQPDRDDAFDIVEGLHKLAEEIAGERVVEIYGPEEE